MANDEGKTPVPVASVAVSVNLNPEAIHAGYERGFMDCIQAFRDRQLELDVFGLTSTKPTSALIDELFEEWWREWLPPFRQSMAASENEIVDPFNIPPTGI